MKSYLKFNVKTLILILLCSFFFHTVYAQDYYQMPIASGFNVDIIANGVGLASQSTTAGLDDSDYTLISRDYQTTSTSSPLSYGLPTNGLINSVVVGTPGLSYQLASYNVNNALKLVNTNSSGILTFVSPVKAKALYMLATSGSGVCTVAISVNFTDGTSQDFVDVNISDWYYGSGHAIWGIGRINRSNNVLENGNGTNPRLYQFRLDLAESNYTKLIKDVRITKTSIDGVPNVFAFSADLYNACTAPQDIIANVEFDSAEISWQASSALPSNGYDYYLSATDEAPTATTTPTGHTLTTSISLNSLIIGKNYNIWIRSNCGTGSTGFWKKKSFTTAQIKATYTEDEISTELNAYVTTFSSTSCPGTLSVSVPPGYTIKNTAVAYNMATAGNAWISDQRSLLACITNNTAETAITTGSGASSGTYSYNRTDIPIANGLTGTVVFELRAWRIYGGSGCSSSYNYVVNGTWEITLTLEPLKIQEIAVDETLTAGLTYGDAEVAITGLASASSSLPVSYSVLSGPVTYNATDQRLNITGAGEVKLKAEQAGNNEYAATSKEITFNIAKADQNISWATPSAIQYGTKLSAAQLNATVIGVTGGSATGTLSYSPVAGTLLDVGTHTLSVTAAATSNYKEATKTVELTVINTLPVTLVSFTAKIEGNYPKLEWQTTSENNNKEFVIYRSGDDQSFTPLGTVIGAGDSENKKNYFYYDKNPLADNNYYRLVQVNHNGESTELGIKLVAFNIEPSVHLYPNPATAIMKLSGEIFGSYDLFDMRGQKMKSGDVEELKLGINVSYLPAGQYYISLKNRILKFLKQ